MDNDPCVFCLALFDCLWQIDLLHGILGHLTIFENMIKCSCFFLIRVCINLKIGTWSKRLFNDVLAYLDMILVGVNSFIQSDWESYLVQIAIIIDHNFSHFSAHIYVVSSRSWVYCFFSPSSFYFICPSPSIGISFVASWIGINRQIFRVMRIPPREYMGSMSKGCLANHFFFFFFIL